LRWGEGSAVRLSFETRTREPTPEPKGNVSPTAKGEKKSKGLKKWWGAKQEGFGHEKKRKGSGEMTGKFSKAH